jgi:murein L,D-transpeptidase YcbB/YkuD
MLLQLLLLLQAVPDTGAAIRRAIAQLPAPDRAVLDSAYSAGGWRLFWHNGAVVTPGGVALARELGGVRLRGLDEGDYLPTLYSGTGLESLVAHDISMSRGALRMARDLRRGRISPRSLSPSWHLSPRAFDGVTTLQRLLHAASVAAVFDSLEPRDPGYWRLRGALPALMRLAGAAPEFTVRAFPRTLRLGDSTAVVLQLRMRLQLLGDLAADSTRASSTAFDDEVAQAVQRFQARHGLAADGVVGAATLEALAVPLHWRARQVELALERWRWFSEPGDAPVIEVNVADATLQFRDSLLGAERFAGRVIVGTTRTPTPILESQVSRVLFNPGWNVPTKIAREELVPTFRADISRFTRGHYELLRGNTVVPPTPENLDAIGRGVNLRQRPGTGNALGRIKFEVRGTTAIHLHDTPSPGLFLRDVRTLSHGCIRVHQPADLAIAVLGPAWTHERIAVATTDTVQVVAMPPRAVAVRLLYMTALLDEQGMLQFRSDPYGRDRALDAALRRRR